MSIYVCLNNIRKIKETKESVTVLWKLANYHEARVKLMEYQRALASMVYKFFDKKTRSGINANEQLAEELHKPVTKRFKRRKVYARFKDNISTADLPDMESLSSKNKNVKYLLCFLDVLTKYSWVKPLKDKKVKQFLMLLCK